MKKDKSKKKRIFRKTYKKRNVIAVIFLVLLLCMGIGYSLIFDNLSILGSINVLGYTNAPTEISINYTEDTNTYAYGDSITVPVTYTNTSTKTAYDVKLRCDQIDTSETTYESLAPGATISVNYVYTVTEEDIIFGNVELDIIAEYKDDQDQTIETSELITMQVEPMNPSLQLTFAEESQSQTPQLAPGESIQFALKLTNDGNVTITNIIADTADAPTTLSDSTPEATENFYYQYTVPADAQEGLISTELTVTGLDPNGDTISTSISIEINVTEISNPDPDNG